MFMRYRGGGIGHKYMRDIEGKYENMSRERLHGKHPRRESGQPRTESTNADSEGDSDNELQDPSVQPSMSQGDQTTGSATTTPGSDEDDESSDEDYILSDDSSGGNETDNTALDSDEFASDDGYDSYGLADP